MRAQHLHLIANNTRFLILPWVRVAHLASHVLARITRRLSRDWQAKYGHPIYLLETFVQCDRFKGSSYRAANWGNTKALREAGEKFDRRHWVYLATVFRLDHRGQTEGKRAVLTQRGYAATRLGLEALSAQLDREALARGLGRAQWVLVIAEGALWIWNLAKDRFPDARQRLDLYHAQEHLWAVANDLCGRGTPEAQAWVAPLLQQIRNDQTRAVIASRTELKPRLLETQLRAAPNPPLRIIQRSFPRTIADAHFSYPTLKSHLLAGQPLIYAR